MKSKAYLPLLFCFAVLQAAFADVDLEKGIVGVWEYKQRSESRSITGYSIFQPDGTGASVGTLTQNGKTAWMLTLFTWKIEKDRLTQVITKANVPNIPIGGSSSDTIVAIGVKSLIRKSGKKVMEENRIEKLPEEFAKRLAEFRSGK